MSSPAGPVGQFITVIQPAQNPTCVCKKPDSNTEKDFGRGTIWACTLCGRGWIFQGYINATDLWARSEANDLSTVIAGTAKYKDGDSTYG